MAEQKESYEKLVIAEGHFSKQFGDGVKLAKVMFD
jgi:hypothetical protein